MKIKKTIKPMLVVSLLLVISSLHGANDPQEVITVRTAKFSGQLVETWIRKYTEIHPDIQIRIVEGNMEEADLELVSETVEDAKEGFTYVGRYALLPVTTTENPLYEQIIRHRFNGKDLKKLFFQNDALQEVEKSKKKDALRESLTVYSGTSRTSGADAFASHFGYHPSQLRGKRIAGDDIYLLTAISKDPTGVTFNNLAYLFDLHNRKLKPQLTLLPLDIKKEQDEILRSGNLDETLQLLENGDINLIPLKHIGFIYREKLIVTDFLYWIVSEGQQYNHDSGFLTIDKKLAQKEQKQLETKLLSDLQTR